ncbi:MAG: zinc-binding dehydrogenase [Bacteroidota bacterium]
MKFVQMEAYGAPEVLIPQEGEIKAPEAGELVIQVEAIGVNYSDILRRRNTYFMPTPLPYILGSEAVGIIQEKGSGLEESPFKVGQRVLAILPSGGGYASVVKSAAAYCVPLPESIDPKVATAIFVQGSTAYLMINDLLRDLKGKSVLVMAAAGGVGSLLVQLAKSAGAKVIAAASQEDKLAYAKKLGADAGVNYQKDDWVEKVMDANAGEKVDVILEMVGGEIFEKSLGALKSGGKMVIYGAASGKKGMLHSEHLVDENIQMAGFNLAHYIQHKTALWQEALGRVIELLLKGDLKVYTPQVFALSEAARAHQAIENRESKGKIVLVP